ncbi:MAG: TetR/AcrR family transcriptional regulator [Planctomycetota bacterium]
MPSPRIDDFELLTCLFGVFRRHGYEGTSLSDLCAASGLQRASLYHRFPAGKLGMAQAVLDHVSALLEEEIFPSLEGSGEPEVRLRKFSKALRTFYEDGAAPCLIDAFTLTSSEPSLQERIRAGVDRWLQALIKLSRDSGCKTADAKRRAERSLAAIQGGLVLSRSMGETTPFRRALSDLPELLLEV